MRRFMEMDINELYEKLAWMIRYPFAITTKALQNHGKLIKPLFLPLLTPPIDYINSKELSPEAECTGCASEVVQIVLDFI